MKLKNIKIRTKLVLGFGLLIGLTLALGGITISSMVKIQQKTGYMANEFAPEVEIGNSIERHAYMAMNADLNYATNHEKKDLDSVYSNIEKVKTFIKVGYELVEKSSTLDSLNYLLEEAEKALNNYEIIVKETADLTQKLDDNRAEMDVAAQYYISTLSDFSQKQESLISQDLAKGRSVNRRLKMMGVISQNTVTSYQTIELSLKGQLSKDMSVLKGLIQKLSEENSTTILTQNASTKEDLATIEEIQGLNDFYLEALTNYVQVWDKKLEAERKKEIEAGVFLAAAKASAMAGVLGTKDLANQSIGLVNYSNFIVIVGLSLVVVFGFLFAILTTKSITQPIFESVKFAQSLSEGNLTVEVDQSREDEIGVLTKAMGNMVQKLKSVLSDVSANADYIANASTQMSNASQQISDGANEQAASSEEVASSMEQMTSNIQHNTKNAKETEIISHKAARDIKESSEAVNQTVKSMKSIANKISIIGEIARQTNILALNAAVEAARAGEHGKGFAVVAAEVRKLAERSHIAAVEIDELSKSSVEVAEKSGKLLDSLVPDINKTAELVKFISESSINQEESSIQVSAALQQLNTIVQQNAASAEEMAGSSHELAGNSEKLKELISFFTIGEQHLSEYDNQTSTPSKKTNHTSKAGNSITQSEDRNQNRGISIDLDERNHLDLKSFRNRLNITL